MRLGWPFAVGLAWGTACFPTSEYRCQADTQCVAGGETGVCQDGGFCSFPDDTCPSNQRYAKFSEKLGGSCVPLDGSSDTEGGGTTTTGASDSTSASSTSSISSDTSGGAITITDLEVTAAIDHNRVGNLVIKLVPPGAMDAEVLTIQSRSEYRESADDGSGPDSVDSTGDRSDLTSAAPVVYRDNPMGMEGVDWRSARNMGRDLGLSEFVCQTDNICVYEPSPGAGPGTNLDDFDGQDPVGTWQLCVGDADGWVDTTGLTGIGTFATWTLHLFTDQGMTDHSSGAAADLTIPDDAYDGTLASMACLPVDVAAP